MNKENIDLNSLLIKPMYIGLAINSLFPITLLLIAYFSNTEAAKSSVAIPAEHSLLFWILIGVAVVDGFFAIFIRQNIFFKPMIVSAETYKTDITERVMSNSIACSAIAAAISVYGFIFWLVSGAFKPFLFFVILSVVAYQVVRPRHGFMQKVIDHQFKLAEEGKFAERRK